MEDQEQTKQICMNFLKMKHKNTATMKTPYWQHTVRRPMHGKYQGILSYEIYSRNGMPGEHDIVKALNALVAEDKAEIFYSNSFIWYALK